MDIANLKGSAAKLLLHTLLNQGADKSFKAQMRAIGTSDRKTYYDAKHQLTELALLDVYGNPTKLCMETLHALYENHTPMYENHTTTETGVYGNPTTVYENHTIPPEPVYENPTQCMESIQSNEAQHTYEYIPPTLLERIVEADNMPDDGDKMRPESNFQKRRKVQIPLVVEAVGEFLPDKYPFSERAAQELLVLTDNCAQDIYDVVQEVKEWGDRRVAKGGDPITSPGALLKKWLQRRREEGAPSRRAETATEELPPASPEFLAKIRARRDELVASGRYSLEAFE